MAPRECVLVEPPDEHSWAEAGATDPTVGLTAPSMVWGGCAAAITTVGGVRALVSEPSVVQKSWNLDVHWRHRDTPVGETVELLLAPPRIPGPDVLRVIEMDVVPEESVASLIREYMSVKAPGRVPWRARVLSKFPPELPDRLLDLAGAVLRDAAAVQHGHVVMSLPERLQVIGAEESALLAMHQAEEEADTLRERAYDNERAARRRVRE